MGVGTSRGRRSIHTLRINDVVDFWRVEDMVNNKSIVLRAEMILPGKAWIEFTIQEEEVEQIKWFTKDELLTKYNSNPEIFIKSMKNYIYLFDN